MDQDLVVVRLPRIERVTLPGLDSTAAPAVGITAGSIELPAEAAELMDLTYPESQARLVEDAPHLDQMEVDGIQVLRGRETHRDASFSSLV
jgi:hypothetical protein